MATSGKRTASERNDEAADGPAEAANVLAGVPELAQRQMVSAVDAMGQLFSRYESLHRAQLHLAERAVLLHRQASDNLRKATTPMELASIQGTLLMYQFQEGTRFWQEWMGAAMGRTTTDSALGASLGSTGQGDAAASPAVTAMGAAMTAAAPMAEAIQQMFMAPLNAASSAH